MILVNSFGGCGTTMFIKHLWFSTFSNGRKVAPFLVWDGGRSGSGKDSCREFKHISSPPEKDAKKQHTGPLVYGIHHNVHEDHYIRRRGVVEETTNVVIDRAVYLYVNPLDAILTFFNNLLIADIEGDIVPWVVRHTKSIGGDWQALLQLVAGSYIKDPSRKSYFMHNVKSGIDTYANCNNDLLGLEYHFDSWTTSNNEYPILAVKYESMWDPETLKKISKFLDLRDDFIDDFPHKAPRRNELTSISPVTRSGLESTYQSLINKINAAPACMINGEKY